MMKIKIIAAGLLIILLFAAIAGCSRKTEFEDSNKDIPEHVTEPDLEETPVILEGIPSPLSGIYADEKKINRRPLVVVFDNQSAARPQAGLIDAEISYEFMVEGNITRYVGVFLINEPEIIGPVRSARSYLVQKAVEYGGYFVHVGGNNQAFTDIANYRVADIDAMSRGKDTFWRKNHKRAPHNVYTSHRALRKAAEESGFKENSVSPNFKISSEVFELEGNEAKHVKINYSKGYEPSFQYDAEQGKYLRFYNNKPHLDETSRKQLTCTNIIIQEVKARVADSEGRLNMATIGEGKGIYITRGRAVNITWRKDGYRTPVKYFDEMGRELALNPGQTWIQVVNTLDKVSITGEKID